MLLSRGGWMVGALLLSTCSAPPQPSDAQPATDAGFDAGRDAGALVDTGVDAGAPSGWQRLRGLPDDCIVESAETPSAELSLTWRACEPAAEGCLLAGPMLFDGWMYDRGWFDGRQGYFAVSFLDRRDRIVAALLSTEDGAVGYWRSYRPPADRRACRVGAVGVGDEHAAFEVEYVDYRARDRDQDIVFHGAIADLALVLDPRAVIIGDIAAGGAPQGMAVTSELVAYAWHPGAFIYVVGADGSQYALIDDPVVGSPQNPSAVGTDVFWEDWATAVRVAHARRDSAPAFFLDIAPDDVVHYTTDGVDHVWLEGRGDRPGLGYTTLTLFTARFVSAREDLEPREVGPVDNVWPFAYGGGWYAYVRGDLGQLEVIRTSDGTRRTWRPPVEHELLSRAPIYASDHEVLVHTRREEQDYLFRVDPHAMAVAE